MAEQKTTERREEPRPLSIAEALNAGMKTFSTLVANYTAAVQASQKQTNGEADSETEHQSRSK
jgi:hypothetical protein